MHIPDFVERDFLIEALKMTLNRGRFAPSYIYGDGYSGLRAAEAIMKWVPDLKNRN